MAKYVLHRSYIATEIITETVAVEAVDIEEAADLVRRFQDCEILCVRSESGDPVGDVTVADDLYREIF